MTTTGGSTVLRWAGATDVGKVRANNQDQFMLRPETRLWVVADGMGGHKGGEEASDLACRMMARVYQDQTVDGLVAAVTAANQAVHEAGLANPELRGMGTTLVALAVVRADDPTEAPTGETLAIANVGDSRAYRLTEGRLEQLTEDHSLVADMVREGSLSPDEAESHPQKNILTRVLGVYEEIAVDIITVPPRAGDRYLLCSDGLFNEVPENTIASVLTEVRDPDAAARKLIDLALDHGARDNTTVLLVDVMDDGTGGPATAAVPRAVLAQSDIPTMDGGTAVTGRPIGAYSDPVENGDGHADADDPDGSSAGGKRRRRGRDKGAPRQRAPRFTWRVGLFLVLLLALFVGAAATIHWYGRAAYYVSFDDDNVAIYQGRPGGVAWVDPELVETSPLIRGDVPARQVAALDSGQEFSSRSAAEEFVTRLEDQATVFILGFDDDAVVIYEDRPGNDPEPVHVSDLDRSDLSADDRAELDEGLEFVGPAEAQDYLDIVERRVEAAQEEEAARDDRAASARNADDTEGDTAGP